MPHGGSSRKARASSKGSTKSLRDVMSFARDDNIRARLCKARVPGTPTKFCAIASEAPQPVVGRAVAELGLYRSGVTSHTSIVPLTWNELGWLRGQPTKSEASFSHRKSLETAIERSQAYLLSIQKPEGYWVG